MVEGAVAGSSTGEGGYGERGGSAGQPYPTHQKTEIQRDAALARQPSNLARASTRSLVHRIGLYTAAGCVAGG